MILTPMTEFVLEQFKLLQSDELNETYYIDRIIRYAKFLSQPLQKQMFVICNNDGTILSEPIKENYSIGDIECGLYGVHVLEFQEAESKVLFDGFEVIDNGNVRNLNSQCLVYTNHFEHHIVESLLYMSNGITLTDIAVKNLKLT